MRTKVKIKKKAENGSKQEPKIEIEKRKHELVCTHPTSARLGTDFRTFEEGKTYTFTKEEFERFSCTINFFPEDSDEATIVTAYHEYKELVKRKEETDRKKMIKENIAHAKRQREERRKKELESIKRAEKTAKEMRIAHEKIFDEKYAP